MATRRARKTTHSDGEEGRGRPRAGRSIWSGHVTFGLVSIPVGIHAALEASERVSFRQLHRKDMAPIRYKKFCSEEDVEVSNDEIVKGYEVRKGEYAPVEKEELDKVQEEVGEGDHTIEIVQFVDFGSLNPLLFEKPYYLSPQSGGAKAYGVLRDALHEARRVGIARFYLRTRPLLAAVMPAEDVLALEVMGSSASSSPDALTPAAPRRAPRSSRWRVRHRVHVGHLGSDRASEHHRKALEKLSPPRPVAVGRRARRGGAEEGRRPHGCAPAEPGQARAWGGRRRGERARAPRDGAPRSDPPLRGRVLVCSRRVCERHRMVWVTRRHIRVNRTATAWLIRRFVDPQAVFRFVEPDAVAAVQAAEGAIGFDAPRATYPHADAQGRCSFEALVDEHRVDDAALSAPARIVRGGLRRPDRDRA
jgi:hypothetical protein